VPVRCRRHQVMVERIDDGGGAVAELELGEQVVDVGLHGALAHHKLGGDVGVGLALAD
jgi:hypothetical protein